MLADLSALLLTASYALTGVPSALTKERRAGGRHPLPALSPAVDALLRKGLHADMRQRFQHPSELRQALQALTRLEPSSRTTVISVAEQHVFPGGAAPTSEPVIHALPLHEMDRGSTPQAAAFPLVPPSHDALVAAGWVTGTLLAEVAVLLLSR